MILFVFLIFVLIRQLYLLASLGNSLKVIFVPFSYHYCQFQPRKKKIEMKKKNRGQNLRFYQNQSRKGHFGDDEAFSVVDVQFLILFLMQVLPVGTLGIKLSPPPWQKIELKKGERIQCATGDLRDNLQQIRKKCIFLTKFCQKRPKIQPQKGGVLSARQAC